MIKSVLYPQGLYRSKYANLSSMAFAYPSCLITAEDVSREIRENYARQITSFNICESEKKLDKEMILTSVEVKILDLAWLYSDGMGFNDFATFLIKKKIVVTDFARIMLDCFWFEYKGQLFCRILLPYVAYLGLTIYFSINVVCTETAETTTLQKWMGGVFLISLFYQVWVEIVQLNKKGFAKYASEILNIIDGFMNSVNMFFAFTTIF